VEGGDGRSGNGSGAVTEGRDVSASVDVSVGRVAVAVRRARRDRGGTERDSASELGVEDTTMDLIGSLRCADLTLRWAAHLPSS